MNHVSIHILFETSDAESDTEDLAPIESDIEALVHISNAVKNFLDLDDAPSFAITASVITDITGPIVTPEFILHMSKARTTIARLTQDEVVPL